MLPTLNLYIILIKEIKMYKYIFIIIICLSGCQKPEAIILSDNFVKLFGGEFDDIAVSLLHENTNILILSNSFNRSRGRDSDISLLKVDKYGQLKWQSYFGGDNNDTAKKVISDSEFNFFILAELHTNNSRSISLIKVDSNGNEIFSKIYEPIDPLILKYTAVDILDAGNNLVILATIDDEKRRIAILYVNKLNGNIVEDGFRRFGFESSNDEAVSLCKDGEDVLFLATTDKSENTSQSKSNFFIGSTRGVLFRTFGGINAELGTKLIKTIDGRYLILGSMITSDNSKVVFTKVRKTSSGFIEENSWPKILDYDHITAQAIQEINDGGYVILGVKMWNNSNSDIVDELSWPKYFGNEYFEEAKAIIQTDELGLVILSTISNSSNGLKKVCLIKTNSDGDFDF